jgi:hypothetical protein
MRGARMSEVHLEHYYQRLVQLGVGHRNTALLEYTLMLSVGVSALWALRNPDALPVIAVAWTLIYGLAMVSLDYWWKGTQRA